MEIQSSQDELEKYAKQSKKILYSTDVLKQENKLILKELIGLNNENLWALILKYDIDEGLNQEVILGTLRMTNERRRKISDIRDFISKQLEQNLDKYAGFSYYEDLEKYKKKEAIPFDFTEEGKIIITCKSSEPLEIERTVFESDERQLKKIYPKKEIVEIEDGHNELDASRLEKEEQWKIDRANIIENMTKQEKEKFLLGEKISEVIQKTEVDYCDMKETAKIKSRFKRKVASKYLLGVLENEKGYDDIQAAKTVLLDLYKVIKEKGLSSDVISTLEFLEKKIYDKILKQNGNIGEAELKDIEVIQKGIRFFNIVQRGMDLNARLYALKIANLDFDRLNDIIEEFEGKDSQVLEYIKLKKEMVNETQTENIKLDESRYSSVKRLYKFILDSEVKGEAKYDEEYLIQKVFEQYKTELVRDNKDSIDVYNQYAKVYDRYICSVSKDVSEFMQIDSFDNEKNQENEESR